MERKAIIEAKNLVKTYGEGEALTYALNDVSIKVYEHDFLVILGGSGSGKSTFLNMIGAIDNVDSGEIFVNGRDICKINDKGLTLYRRNEIGFVYHIRNDFGVFHSDDAICHLGNFTSMGYQNNSFAFVMDFL